MPKIWNKEKCYAATTKAYEELINGRSGNIDNIINYKTQLAFGLITLLITGDKSAADKLAELYKHGDDQFKNDYAASFFTNLKMILDSSKSERLSTDSLVIKQAKECASLIKGIRQEIDPEGNKLEIDFNFILVAFAHLNNFLIGNDITISLADNSRIKALLTPEDFKLYEFAINLEKSGQNFEDEISSLTSLGSSILEYLDQTSSMTSPGSQFMPISDIPGYIPQIKRNNEESTSCSYYTESFISESDSTQVTNQQQSIPVIGDYPNNCCIVL